MNRSGALIWTAASICVLACAPLEAGSVHIRWGPDAPERLEHANILYYEKILAAYKADPTRFDKEHPFYGELFSDPALIKRVVQRWEAHEQRFEYYHPCLWRVLDGYVNAPQQISPPTTPPGQQKGGHPRGGGGGPLSATPEPTSLELMLTGIGAVTLVAAWRAGKRRRCAGITLASQRGSGRLSSDRSVGSVRSVGSESAAP